MIKAILFDFGQTLVDSSEGFRQAEKQAQEILFKDLKHKSWTEFKEFYRTVRKGFQDSSNFSRYTLWEAVYVHYQKDFDQETLAQMESNYWWTVEKYTKPFLETNGVLEELSKSYKLGLITNTQGQIASSGHRITQFPEIERLFDAIILAGEDGVPAKPAQEPFLLCLSKLASNPSETIYVGDDWQKDILGAQKAGIKPVWLKHKSVTRNWPDVEATIPVITSLDDLHTLINLERTY